MQILQSSPQAILNWNQFNIGLGETVRFLQPSTQAAILNRVTGTDPSLIQGMLQANGNVFLLNPNGILFGPNSVVDVGSFTASTLKMSDDDFLSGTYKMTQDRSLPLAAITNQGQIHVAEGGYVVLTSPLLDNQGLIVAQSGTVRLGATTQATFSVDGRGQVQFAMPDGFNPQFTGGGQGGTVLLQPGQVSSILSQVVSNPGLVEAGSLVRGSNGQSLAHGAEGVLINSGTIQADRGSVRLDSSQATVLTSSGLISARNGEVRVVSDGTTLGLGTVHAPNGFAEISAQRLWLYGPVSAGTLLLDPTNITIISGANGDGANDAQLGSLPPGNAQVSTGAIINAASVLLNATNDITFTRNGTAPSPDLIGVSTTLNMIAGNDITLDPGNAHIELASLIMQANRNITLNNVGLIKTYNGPIRMTTNTGDISLTSSGSMTLAATQDITLAGGQDVKINLPGGFTLDESSTAMTITGRDVSIRSDFLGQSVANTLRVDATRNVDLRSNPSDIMSWNLSALNVSAGGSLTAHADQNFSIGTNPGDLRLVATGALSVDSSNQNLALSSNGVLTLGGRSVLVSAAGGLAVTGANGLNLTSTNGNIQVNSNSNGAMVSSAGAINIQSTGGDINYSSAANLDLRAALANSVNSSNNLTITTGNGNTLALNGTPTILHADHDVDLHTAGITGGNHPISITAGDNVTFNPGAGSTLDFSQTQSLNVNAANDLVANLPNQFLITTNAGDQILTAGRNLAVTSVGQQAYAANGGRIAWQGGSVKATSGSTQTWNGPNGITIQTTGLNGADGNLTLLNNGNGDINLGSTGGDIGLNSAHDLSITAPAQVAVKSNPGGGTTTINASNDLTMTTGNFQSLVIGGTTAKVKSGNDMTLTADAMLGDGAAGTTLNLQSGRDLLLQHQGAPSGLNLQSPAINATAVRDLTADGGSSLFVSTGVGDLRLQGDRNLRLTTTGPLQIQSSGALVLQGGNLTTDSTVSSTLISGRLSTAVTATSGNANLHTGGTELRVESPAGPTNITAGGNISMVEPQNLVLSGSPLTVQATNGNLDLGTGDSSQLTPSGNAVFSAGGNLTYTGGRIASVSKVNMQTTNGNLTLQSSPSGTLAVSAGGLNITSGNDLTARSDVDVNLSSTSGTDLNLAAGRNLTVSAPTGAVTLVAGAGNLSLSGQNVTVLSQNNSAIKSALGTGKSLTISATAGDIDLQVTGAGNGFDLGADQGASLAATGLLRVRAAGTGSTINSGSGNVTLSGAQGIDTTGAVLTISGAGARILTNFNTNFAAGSVATASSAGVNGNSTRDLDLSNLRLNVAGGNVTLNADRNLKVNDVLFPAGANATLTGGNITLQSMQNLRSGNVTITTPGNLTELAPGVAGVLPGLNITAGQIHNLNNTADNVSFSIPNTTNPANLHVLVTGGNDTVVPSAANLRNFGGANVQPQTILGSTGDVYVDGVLRIAGSPAVVPPAPPAPPPIPSQPGQNSASPPLNTALTADERAQILAQSNLALGNLGSFSRVLSRSEVDHFTARMDALHSPWNQDPFSPTLALILPGGPPVVSAAETAELEQMLGMDVAAAVNTMVAQEFGFIWEVRYWRNLTERLIIWEDRE